MNKYQEATLVQAIQYARRGWHVLPCNFKKRPVTANGFYDASTEEEQIMAWWEENPKALIGIRTGKESGFWAVDIDMKGGKDGLESLKSHFGDSLILGDGLFQKTPTGGLHLCFKYDEDKPVGLVPAAIALLLHVPRLGIAHFDFDDRRGAPRGR